MKLNDKIISMRVELQEKTLRKSGKNKFAGFEYYELSDFLPTINSLMLGHKINDLFTIENGYASLTLTDGEDSQVYSMPFVMFDTPVNKNGQQSMQPIQYLGALNTYYKRYLYLNAFGITDGEVIDSMDSQKLSVPEYKTVSKSTAEEKLKYKKEFINICAANGIDMGNITDFFNFCDPTINEDEKLKGNTIVQFLRSGDYFTEQVEAYLGWKSKQQ